MSSPGDEVARVLAEARVKLCVFAFMFLHDSDAASEIVSSVFESVLQSGTLDVTKHPETFLRVRVRWACLDYLRKKKSHGEVDLESFNEGGGDCAALAAEALSPAEFVLEAERVELVGQAFDAARYRLFQEGWRAHAMIVSRYFERLSAEEIGIVYKLSARMVHLILRKGQRRLKIFLMEEMEKRQLDETHVFRK